MTLIGAYFPSLVVEPHLASRMYPLSKICAFMMEEFGYFHLQATKPDTVGKFLAFLLNFHAYRIKAQV